MRVPFNVLRPGDDRAAIDAAIARVIDSGWFVLGPEVAAFEAEFAAAAGRRARGRRQHRHRRASRWRCARSTSARATR